MQGKEAQRGRYNPPEHATTRTYYNRDVEKRCRIYVHKYALAAGCMSILPIPMAGVAFNDHALQKLSDRILQLFDLTEDQLTKDTRDKNNKVREMGMQARKILTSKRSKGALITILSKYGLVNVSRFTPGIGIALSCVASILIIEYVGHKLIDECLRWNQATPPVVL